ncbi:hypothetical protein PT286_10100 [Neisseriaceae bacterium ESL0693]|nr:hypothetical protein [Neisseriaceae bacterium ESL0693]
MHVVVVDAEGAEHVITAQPLFLAGEGGIGFNQIAAVVGFNGVEAAVGQALLLVDGVNEVGLVGGGGLGRLVAKRLFKIRL